MSSSLLLVQDHSKEKLQEVPQKVLEMTNLKMLFLEGNFLYKLPEDFFWKLPRLVWLDLRNNQLESLPKSVAHHEYLENLLLTNNNLKKLPNELGLVSKLKALQVSENPLVYPARKVIVEGTKAIKTYLKKQYEKCLHVTNPPEESKREKIEGAQEKEELICIQNFSTSEESISVKPKYGKIKKKREKEIKEVLNKMCDPRGLQPTLKVKKLSHTNVSKTLEKREDEKKKNEPLKIVHKISRKGDTISLTSSLDRVGIRNIGNIADSGLKEGWLNQLRLILSDQERILQQERSLRALSDWRAKKRPETPKVFRDNNGTNNPAPPPYATYPEYAKMPTREALATQLNTFFREKGLSRTGLKEGNTLNVDKLINDLVEQLKEMEHTYGVTRSPRSEIEEAERQIKTITDIHKKLLQLKSTNNLTV